MRQFQFTKGEIQATVKVDIIDAKTQLCTIMEIRGGKGNEFESIFPWKIGAVVYRQSILDWFANYAAVWTGYEYGGAEIVALNDSDAVKTLTITPDITGNTKATVRMHIKNSDGYEVGYKDIEITDEVDVEEDVMLGFKYSFTPISTGAAWTSTAPSEITVDGDETVTLAITVSGASNSNNPDIIGDAV